MKRNRIQERTKIGIYKLNVVEISFSNGKGILLKNSFHLGAKNLRGTNIMKVQLEAQVFLRI